MRYTTAPSAPLFSDGGSGTLRLLAYLVVAVSLMVADHRGGYLDRLRSLLGVLNEPLYQLAQSPATLGRYLYDSVVERHALADERDRVRDELLIARAQLARLEAVQSENRKLRELLGGTRGLGLSVRLVSLADVDLDPFRHRALLDLGERAGVEPGMALIDAGGVYGQVTDSGPLRATATLISDPAHALPVQVQRSGVRTIAYGTGEPNRLRIPNIPQSADIEVGDLLITSGLGGRFPAGLPVGRIVDLRSDDTRLFLVADAEPSALLGRGRELLLVWSTPGVDEEFGPPRELATPPPAAVAGASTP